jgi:hypothetical protein
MRNQIKDQQKFTLKAKGYKQIKDQQKPNYSNRVQGISSFTDQQGTSKN